MAADRRRVLYSGPVEPIPPDRQAMPLSTPRMTQVPGPYRAAVELASADPAAFLGSVGGEARGFWGRDGRWVAWAGALARIEPAPGAGSRFEVVRREAANALEGLGVPLDTTRPSGPLASWSRSRGSAAPAEPYRFFGGFSFLDDGAPGEGWAGFPPASFILPRIVLEGWPGRVRLFGDLDPGELAALAERIGSSPSQAGSAFRPAAEGSFPPMAGASARRPGPAEGEGEATTPEDRGVRTRWEGGVARVLSAIREGTIEKAVLARFLDVRFEREVDLPMALRFLRDENRRANVFLFEPRSGGPFLGAAPELLASLHGSAFEATAVAGSTARSAGASEDADQAARLFRSAKDRAEHGVTVDDMVEVLHPHLLEMAVAPEPSVLTLARIHHLETLIRGVVEPGVDILTLVEALHPTPAVCGRPRAAAMELIRNAEPFDRGWYAGPVGWFDGWGHGEFAPALRSAVGGGREWRLHAGAGIVAGSEPEAEWDETALKFEPALRALRRGAGEDPDHLSEPVSRPAAPDPR